MLAAGLAVNGHLVTVLVRKMCRHDELPYDLCIGSTRYCGMRNDGTSGRFVPFCGMLREKFDVGQFLRYTNLY